MTTLLKHPGDTLTDLITQNSGNIMIICPFIKVDALKRLTRLIDDQVNIQCVTRWLLPELAAGISDLETFELLSQRGNASVHLRNNLHAKYFRRGDHCLIGSANLTLAGMGWKTPSNLEILTRLPQTTESLSAFENSVLREATMVDQSIYEDIRETLKSLEQPTSDIALPPGFTSDIELATWIPTLRNPQDLFMSYCGRGIELHQSARESAAKDLQIISPPPGLQEKTFDRVVGTILLKTPLLKEIDELARTPRRFGVFRDFISSRIAERDASTAWQTAMRWLLHFCPDRYEAFTPNYSEVFGHRRSVSKISLNDQEISCDTNDAERRISS